MSHNRTKLIVFIFLFVLLAEINSTSVSSPNGNLVVNVGLSETGSPEYEIIFKSQIIIKKSKLGFILKNSGNLSSGFEILDTKQNNFSEKWKPVWGEVAEIENNYHELSMNLSHSLTGIKLNIIFRVYDYGLGFRYEFPEQTESDELVIMDELTEFALTGDHEAWWIPADHDSYEYKYQHTKVSEINADLTEYAPRGDRFISNKKAVNTPFTLRTGKGLYLSFHEAGLIDYADMTLSIEENYGLKTDLVPWADGSKVKSKAPFNSPWRTIQIAEKAADLIESYLILNLNEPNKLEDVSWIKPMKYIGIWWEMHIDKSSWKLEKREGSWSGSDELPHGATTENAKRYIDFASANNIDGVLIEGWNTGWEYWGADTVGFFDFVTPYRDFDIHEVVRYANEKGVEIIGHHETAGDMENYEKRLDAAFKFYHELGIKSVKTGYAGPIRTPGERHHGQYMVRHYQKVIETAARYQITIDAHEPIKPTGIRRTYPNFMTREGVRGMEYNAWSDGNMPSHTTILPFTRMLAGPLDYTPGIFDITIDSKDGFDVKSTIANQLALMIILYSPLQMAADLIENYEHPAFQFLREVPANWSDTKVLNGEIGEYVTIARKNGESWYIGAITNEEGREINLELSFLNPKIKYEADIYSDTKDAHFKNNPEVIDIIKQKVSNKTNLKMKLAPGGGQAIIIKPLQ